MAGSQALDQHGIYGQQGVTSPSNSPGSRSYSTMWIDLNDTIWIFGGTGWDESSNVTGYLNDLWRFDGKNWTWVRGNSSINQLAMYNASQDSSPGGRKLSIGWNDGSSFWLFGGYGRGSNTIGTSDTLSPTLFRILECHVEIRRQCLALGCRLLIGKSARRLWC
jgi:hypothetical protein